MVLLRNCGVCVAPVFGRADGLLAGAVSELPAANAGHAVVLLRLANVGPLLIWRLDLRHGAIRTAGLEIRPRPRIIPP